MNPSDTFDYCFTVFTPVYNRAHILHRVYNSLKAQTFRDFEWLVVDDGSTDNSVELVRKWKEEQELAPEGAFPVRIIEKKNGGKHTASNIAVEKARGRFFLTFDSDDSCVPEALERFVYHWNSIPESEKPRFSAVTVLCMRPDGTIEGSRFPESPLDSNSVESHAYYKVSGEKWGFQRTDLMRQFPFPEYLGERFIPESVVWNRIAQQYKTRYVNEALRIYYPEDDSLSSSVLAIRVKSPRGTALMYNELSGNTIPVIMRMKAVINYIRFSFHGKNGLSSIVHEALRPMIAFLLSPVGYIFYLRDTVKMRSMDASR